MAQFGAAWQTGLTVGHRVGFGAGGGRQLREFGRLAQGDRHLKGAGQLVGGDGLQGIGSNGRCRDQQRPPVLGGHSHAGQHLA